jgi:hypothetical protein
MKRLVGTWLAAMLALAASGGPAPAQDLAAIQKAEDAVIEAWSASPISFRRAIFVAASPGGFGIFNERPNAVFKPGEPLIVYAEPVGYAWKDNGDGTYTFGFEIDLLLKTAAGAVVGGQEKFQRLALTSHARNREFMLTLTLNLTGAPAGDYVVEYRARDIASDKSGLISLPFTVSQ